MKKALIGFLCVVSMGASAKAESHYTAKRVARETSDNASDLVDRLNRVRLSLDLSSSQSAINEAIATLEETLSGKAPGGGRYLPEKNSALDPVRNQLQAAIQTLQAAVRAQNEAAANAVGNFSERLGESRTQSMIVLRSARRTESVVESLYCE